MGVISRGLGLILATFSFVATIIAIVNYASMSDQVIDGVNAASNGMIPIGTALAFTAAGIALFISGLRR